MSEAQVFETVMHEDGWGYQVSDTNEVANDGWIAFSEVTECSETGNTILGVMHHIAPEMVQPLCDAMLRALKRSQSKPCECGGVYVVVCSECGREK